MFVQVNDASARKCVCVRNLCLCSYLCLYLPCTPRTPNPELKKKNTTCKVQTAKRKDEVESVRESMIHCEDLDTCSRIPADLIVLSAHPGDEEVYPKIHPRVARILGH